MSINRRNFLFFLGGTAGTVALSSLQSCSSDTAQSVFDAIDSGQNRVFSKFSPVKGPIPLSHDSPSKSDRTEDYSTYDVLDDLVLPDGFQYDVLFAWGDRLGDSRIGYNNDYLSFVETGKNEGYLTVNFEYISAKTWLETYESVIGTSLPVRDVLEATGGKILNAFALGDNNPLKAQIRHICREALIDQGLGVVSLRRDENGKWIRNNDVADRRVTGISGLEDDRYLKSTGAATVIFRKTNKQGYDDGLGDRVIGTFANCAGGTTPWGTVLSAEENFHAQVPEAVNLDGSSVDPSQLPFFMTEDALYGQGNVFQLAGNKYGWIVEIDPANPNDYGTKHTWLGRYRHEAVGVRAEAGKPLAFYSGCDRRGGHIYKFISRGLVTNPTDKANSQLLADGMLYGAKFNPDGTGTWIPLTPQTPVDPDSPSQIVGGQLILHSPSNGQYFAATTDAQIAAYKRSYQTLDDIYTGTPAEKQGAILIDAHFAANAVGVTCTARPEDTEIAPDGSLYISFTSGSPDSDGGPDARVFKSPNGEVPYEPGWIMRLEEDDSDPAAMRFRWQMVAMGGEPAEGGLGFANPDNLLVDRSGNIWMVTDMSTSKHNRPVASRTDDLGNPLPSSKLLGVYGNNSIWYVPTSGRDAGKAFLFGMGPMECETTGPFFTQDETTLFLGIQHPGESHGTRQNYRMETRKFVVKTPEGEEIVQMRNVPIGSNWPGKQANEPPKPAVVAIYREDGASIA
ncbi:Tat (twin-arginine translocation) pathway signal sequence domain protein [Geitlerinema sp. FC II]|nr:Tat (twin-arginine translocation) pathway signal sequence domain protein [Geitlerinema sp. FC II]